MNLDGATILVTGATDGVGKVVAHRIAESGAQLLIHGRNGEKGRTTVEDIQRATGNSRVEFYRADFSSLVEVRRLASDVTARYDRLDVLINNAGIGFGAPGTGRQISRDGHELRFAVNYLAPFLLTHLWLPVLRQHAPSRIINVASLGQAPLDFNDVMMTRAYDGTLAYRRSKAALIMFTLDLPAMLKGTNVTANAIHPATFMKTNMVIEAGVAPRSTVDEGADAIMHLVTSPELENTSGAFFNGQRESRALPQAYDPGARRRLRELSLELTGLQAQM